VACLCCPTFLMQPVVQPLVPAGAELPKCTNPRQQTAVHLAGAYLIRLQGYGIRDIEREIVKVKHSTLQDRLNKPSFEKWRLFLAAWDDESVRSTTDFVTFSEASETFARQGPHTVLAVETSSWQLRDTLQSLRCAVKRRPESTSRSLCTHASENRTLITRSRSNGEQRVATPGASGSASSGSGGSGSSAAAARTQCATVVEASLVVRCVRLERSPQSTITLCTRYELSGVALDVCAACRCYVHGA
jgi:hypothetical protein